MMNDLRLIRLAIALGQHGSFARAAEALDLSQPSVSRGIAELEHSLGVRLFDRSHKQVLPTAFGRVLLERGAGVLNGAADLRSEIRLLAGLEKGTLSIGAGPFPGETTVPRALAELVRAHPGLQVQLTLMDPQQVALEVLAGRLEVGVADVRGLEREAGLVVEPLPPLRTWLACRAGHPLARAGAAVTLNQALEYPLATTLLRGDATALAPRGRAALSAGRYGEARAAPQITLNSLAAARLIAQHSDTLCIVTADCLPDDTAAGRLVRLPLDLPLLRTHYGVLTLAGRSLAPAAPIFIAHLRRIVAQARCAEPSEPRELEVPEASAHSFGTRAGTPETDADGASDARRRDSARRRSRGPRP
jgi:DNA-binding transcriptional LysR family regulator